MSILQKEWSLTNSETGWIYFSYQTGCVPSVLCLTSLADYLRSKYVHIGMAFLAGLSGILFSLLANGFLPGPGLRTLMGVGNGKLAIDRITGVYGNMTLALNAILISLEKGAE